MRTAPLRDLPLRDVVRLNLVYGLEAGAAFAIAEALFVAVLPWILPWAQGYLATNDAFTVFVSLVYIVSAGLAGCLAGFLLKLAAGYNHWIGSLDAEAACRGLATLGVLALQLVNFGVWARDWAPLLFASLWVVLTVASLTSRERFRQLAPWANPWTASLVPFGTEWLNREVLNDWPAWRAAAADVAFAAAVLIAALLVIRRIGSRRLATAFSLLVVLAAALALNQTVVTADAGAVVPAPPSQPNVILLTLDTVRADHMSLYGYDRPTTPNLERIARDAVNYTRAISAGNMTLSSHASIFTGLYPTIHGAHYIPAQEAGLPLAPDIPSLPAILTAHGYRSEAVLANYAYLDHSFGFARGFQFYDSRAAAPFLAPSRPYYVRERVRNILDRFEPPSAFERQTRRASEINREAVGILKRLKARRHPFFLFLNYMDAHWPYHPPAPYDTMFPGKLPRYTTNMYAAMWNEVVGRHRAIMPFERRYLVSQYDGGIAYIDSQVASLVAGLKRLGLYDNTLLIITADHGEALGDRFMLGHGLAVYQDEVHVPLLIKYPRGDSPVPPGSTVNDLVSSVDLLPTILAVLKYPAPPGIQGKSLLSAAPDPSRTIFSESYSSRGTVLVEPAFNCVERAAFTGPMKLIWSTAGQRDYYDLATDPNESDNLYAADHPAAHRLAGRLEQFVRTAARRSRPAPEVSRGSLDRLRSLGYVQ